MMELRKADPNVKTPKFERQETYWTKNKNQFSNDKWAWIIIGVLILCVGVSVGITQESRPVTENPSNREGFGTVEHLQRVPGGLFATDEYIRVEQEARENYLKKNSAFRIVRDDFRINIGHCGVLYVEVNETLATELLGRLLIRNEPVIMKMLEKIKK